MLKFNWSHAHSTTKLVKVHGGRLYDPETRDQVFEAEFVRRYGEKARGLLRAYVLASATQLRLASLQTFRTGGGEEQRERAIAHLERALGQWDEVVRITRPLYPDMKLTHYNHNAFVANDKNLFHWAVIREEVAADVAIARAARRGE